MVVVVAVVVVSEAAVALVHGLLFERQLTALPQPMHTTPLL
jgi:hypothetical protein